VLRKIERGQLKTEPRRKASLSLSLPHTINNTQYITHNPIKLTSS